MFVRDAVAHNPRPVPSLSQRCEERVKMNDAECAGIPGRFIDDDPHSNSSTDFMFA
jgi:hypothetical protein